MQYEFYRNYWAVSSSDLHVLYDGLETTTRTRLDNKSVTADHDNLYVFKRVAHYISLSRLVI
jgi:hypothetical protein